MPWMTKAKETESEEMKQMMKRTFTQTVDVIESRHAVLSPQNGASLDEDGGEVAAVAANSHKVQKELAHAPQHKDMRPSQGILKKGGKKKKAVTDDCFWAPLLREKHPFPLFSTLLCRGGNYVGAGSSYPQRCSRHM